MVTRTRTPRWFAGAAAATIALATLAPAAQAGHRPASGHKVRDTRGGYVIERVIRPERSVYMHRGSDAGPVLAGLIGGFVLGAMVTQAQPTVYVSTTYWDPYCDERFVDLDRYEWHLRHHRHPWSVRVIDTRSGECVRDEHWRGGGWRYDDDDRGDGR